MRCFLAGMMMLIIEPLFRLPEAILRLRFLPDRYRSFWDALISDWFLGEGWFDYVKTPLGLWFSVFVAAWTTAGFTLVFAAFRSWHRAGKKLAEEIRSGGQPGR